LAAVLTLRLDDQATTRRLGDALAGLLRGGDVILLDGTLGSGKTELARALIRARAGAPIEVPSPSFTLVQDYELDGLTILHIDLYRIEAESELVELDLDRPAADEAWLGEWPARAGGRLGGTRLEIRREPGEGAGARVASVGAAPGWAARLARVAGALGGP
jgi:tRNA threonylcarbamoyl adenosine modification protein YjeE